MTHRAGAGDRPDLQRARESAGARRGAHAAPERTGDGRRRSITGRHRCAGRRSGAQTSRACRGHAPDRRARARTLVHRRHRAGHSSGRRTDLPDGRRPVARSAAPAGTDGGRRACRRRDRFTVCPRRRDPELAAPAPDPQPAGQHLHPSDHQTAPARLHQRISLLAARRARRDAARSLHFERLLVSRRDAVRHLRPRDRASPRFRSRSSSAGRANRSCRARCCSSRRSRRGVWSRAAGPRSNTPDSGIFHAMVSGLSDDSRSGSGAGGPERIFSGV